MPVINAKSVGYGASPPKGWELVNLIDGDQLGSTASVKVDPLHDLSLIYGVSARDIVAGNGVQWSTPAINAWVMRTGGRKLANGQPVFATTSRIYLPSGVRRQKPDAGVVDVVKPAGIGIGILAALVAAYYALKG